MGMQIAIKAVKVNQICQGESLEGEEALELSHKTFQALKVHSI